MKIVCSRCWDVLPAGSTFCPRCLPQGRSFSRLHLVLIAIAMCIAFWFAGSWLYARTLSGTETPKQRFVDEVQAGSLSTPEAFEARCGWPVQVERIGESTVLHYAPGDVRIVFRQGHPADFGRAISTVETASLYDNLHCDGVQ